MFRQKQPRPNLRKNDLNTSNLRKHLPGDEVAH